MELTPVEMDRWTSERLEKPLLHRKAVDDRRAETTPKTIVLQWGWERLIESERSRLCSLAEPRIANMLGAEEEC